MTYSRIKVKKFDLDALDVASGKEIRLKDWPIVYLLNDEKDIYIGETCSAISRMASHKLSKPHLRELRIILQDKSNKSACHDLESHLIKYFHADGKFCVLNGNAGISDFNYFNRSEYRKSFESIFEILRCEKLITKSIPELENTNIFKYSPFKALSPDQAEAITGIIEILLPNRGASASKKRSSKRIVVQGGPGTGKTIVAVFLMKLIRDIALSSESESIENDSIFSDFFQSNYREVLKEWKIGLVIPQQSLRQTIRKVFKSIPGLNSEEMILSPFDVAKNSVRYNLLIVDEAHRLKIRSNMPSGALNRSFTEINQRLFKSDADHFTQLDWIIAQSDSQILLLDSAQSIMPADLTLKAIQALEKQSRNNKSYFSLKSQLRVKGGEEYITYISQILEGNAESKIKKFQDYDCCIFDSIHQMRNALKKRNQEKGLARVVAGYAWPWATRGKSDPALYDIELDGLKLCWNRTDKDWINSSTSLDEVGSIHTVQGYDLNYCGVIVGPDLTFDIAKKSIVFNRDNYHDKKGCENNRRLGITYTDEQLFIYVKQIYRVLLTRAIYGTYIYVCDPALKNYLSQFFLVR